MDGAPEIELKLRLPPGAAASVLRHPLLHDFAAALPRRERLRAVYFDALDDRLAAAGVFLRVRREGARWVQGLKVAAASSPGALSTRTELEMDRGRHARPPLPDPAQWRDTPWQAVLDDALAAGLAARFATDIRRTTVPVRFADGTEAHVAVDLGTLSDGRPPPLSIAELEIELATGDLRTLFRFAQTLALDLPLAIEPRSKAERGFALAQRAAPHPVRAEAVLIDPAADAATARRTILEGCLRQLVANGDGLLRNDDVEWVHQMRIATRRLRACLSLLRETRPPERLDAVVADARWLARSLAPARDLDVLVTATLPQLRASLRGNRAQQGVVDAFTARAERARGQARAAARAAVAAPRYTQLVLGAGALAVAPSRATPAAAPPPRVPPVLRYADDLVRRRHRKLRHFGAGLAHAAADARHEVRLAAKRLRYVTEFFASLFPRKSARAYRRALVRLQDALGERNDAGVALRLAAAIDGPESAVVHLFHQWAARRERPAHRAMMRRWTAFAVGPRLSGRA